MPEWVFFIIAFVLGGGLGVGLLLGRTIKFADKIACLQLEIQQLEKKYDDAIDVFEKATDEKWDARKVMTEAALVLSGD